MSDSRETTLNESPVRRVAADEARLLPLAEVLAHRRHHHHQRRERVRRGRLPGLRLGGELARVAVECIRGGCEDARVRQRLAEGDLPVRVEIGLDAGGELGPRAPEHPLRQVVEIARLLEHPSVGELQVEGDGALGILGLARAGVDDDVVLGERGRAGHDAFHALVVRIALRPEILRLGEQRRDLVAMLAQEPRVVVVDARCELVVVLGEGAGSAP